MKKLTLFALLIFGICISSYSQDPSKRNGKMKNISTDLFYLVEFDFSNPNETILPKNIRKGDFYKVNVCNINLNNYRVEMQIKDTVYYSKALDFPVFGAIDINGLSDIIESFEAFSIVLSPEEKEMDSLGSFNSITKSDIRDFLEKNQETIKKNLDLLDKSISRFNDERFKIATNRILAKADPVPLNTEPIDVSKNLKTFEEIHLSQKLLESEISNNSKEYIEFFEKPDVILLMKEEDVTSIALRQEKEKVDKAYGEIKSKLSKARDQSNPDNVIKILTSILHLYTTSTFTSLPIQFTGDEAELKMSFIPKDSASNLQPYRLSPIKFGRSPWYWAVGPGLYYSKLQNERVGSETIQVNDSTQNFKVLKENSLQGEIGLSALFHAGYKLPILNDFFGIHGSVGTGVSLGEDIRARMLYGFGLSFGQKNHLTLNIGWATGYVDILSESFKEEDYGTKMFVEKPSVLVKKLDTAVFYNVGYVFTF
jgi:hypothetical protein